MGLLWSVPSAPPVETALASATTVMWETERWEAIAPTEPASEAGPVAVPQEATKAVVAVRPRIRSAKALPRSRSAATPGAESEPASVAETTDASTAGAPAGNAAHGGGTVAAATGDNQLDAASGTGTGTGVGSAGPATARALMRGPRLLATRDPCAGFFPGSARASTGQVQLSLDVDAQGHPHPAQTLLELPLGQGFESAAKACAAHLHFAPALDAQGHPVSARARIALRFERS